MLLKVVNKGTWNVAYIFNNSVAVIWRMDWDGIKNKSEQMTSEVKKMLVGWIRVVSVMIELSGDI